MVSAAAVKDVVPAAASLDSGILEDMIGRAEALVERQTGGRFFGKKAFHTEYVSGNGSRHLRLSEQVNGSVSVVNEREYPGGTPTEITDTEYAVRPSGTTSVLVRLGGEKWTLGMEYEVTYQRGYAPDSGPKDIEQLVIDLVALRLNMRGKEGLSSETVGGYSYSKPAIYAFDDGDIKQIPGAMATIQAWRRLVIA